jgi:hypothetical protein
MGAQPRLMHKELKRKLVMTCARYGKENVIVENAKLWCAICGDWTAIVH